MTREEALNNALNEISNYYISRSHDEHLAKQRQEVKDGKR